MKSKIGHARLVALVTYCPETGIFTRRVRLGSRGPVGSRIGWASKNGQRIMRIDDTETTAARFAWFYTHGEWPQSEIVHINGDPTDDRWANLALGKEWFHSELTQERLKLFLAYDPSTGIFTWLQGGHKYKPGTVAGYINDSGYSLIWVSGRDYRAHRLAWFHVYGRWPLGEIDHINGNPSDNRITNLREATRANNTANSRKPITNKSGYKGVSWHAQGRCWQAHIKNNGVNHYLGHFQCPKQAHAAYCEAALRLKGAFARTD
jgi:hypothetical protein